MSFAALDFDKIEAGRQFLCDGPEQFPFATGAGCARIEVHSTSAAANAIFDTGSCLLVGSVGLDDLTVPQIGGTWVRFAGFDDLTGQRAVVGATASSKKTACLMYASSASEPAPAQLRPMKLLSLPTSWQPARPSLLGCLSILRSRRKLLNDTQADALERQLEVLLREEDALKEAKINVSEPSLHGLIDFLSEHKTFAHPSLSITRIGHFAASWSPRKRAKLTIVFNPGGNGEWIAIDLDATHPVHDKGNLANLFDKFAAWMRA